MNDTESIHLEFTTPPPRDGITHRLQTAATLNAASALIIHQPDMPVPTSLDLSHHGTPWETIKALAEVHAAKIHYPVPAGGRYTDPPDTVRRWIVLPLIVNGPITVNYTLWGDAPTVDTL